MANVRSRAIFLTFTRAPGRRGSCRSQEFCRARWPACNFPSPFVRIAGPANCPFFGDLPMKRLMALLLGTMLSAPALAQAPSAAPPAPPAAANGGARYAPAAQRLGEGQYRAEVRRSGAAVGADEVAWSSAPHATMADAVREACKMIETVYTPGMPCPVAGSKKTAAPASES